MFLPSTQIVKGGERKSARSWVLTVDQVPSYVLLCPLVTVGGLSALSFYRQGVTGATSDSRLTHPLVSMVCRSLRAARCFFPSTCHRKPRCPGVDPRPGGRPSAGAPPAPLLCSPLPQPAPGRRQEHLGPCLWRVWLPPQLLHWHS